MTPIRTYTTIEQSRTLAEILPLESADMSYYIWKDDGHLMSPVPFVLDGMEEKEDGLFEYIPCWSLASLLSVLPNENMLVKTTDGEYYCLAKDVMTKHYDNTVDACVAMIEKLHGLKML